MEDRGSSRHEIQESGRQEQGHGQKIERSRRPGYIATIIVDIILLFIANNLLNWHVPFLTKAFVVPLTILNISLSLTILANLLFIFYDPDWFLAITRVGLNIIGVIFIYVLYTVFPFDFSSLASKGLVTLLVRIALILGLAGTAIATVVEFVKFIRAVAKA